MFCLYITHGEAPESCSVALALLASNSALPTSPSPPTKNRVRLLLLLPPTPSLTKIRRLTKLLHHELTQKKRKEMARLALSLEDPPHVVNHRCTGPKKAPK